MLMAANCIGAKDFGWPEICHLLFPEDTVPPPVEGITQIRQLEELPNVYPHLFQKGTLR